VSIIVVKLGSSTLVAPDGQLRHDVLEARVRDLVRIRRQGQRPIIVSSGAVACGLGRLGFDARPTGLADLQAASAVGQGVLFQRYSELFAPHGVIPAQVLLTSADLATRTSYLNARTTLARLLDLGTVPIINENDTTATDELTFGDNDVLAAQVAILLGADRLLLLTERDGLYGRGPGGEPQLLGDVPAGTRPGDLDLADMAGSATGRGGIASKVAAASMATGGGVSCVIASGAADGVITAIASGQHVGTRFRPSERPESAFKLWLRHARTTTGSVHVDAGAARALRERGTSLLAVGVVGCAGAFQPGDAVQVIEVPGQVPVGKGIVRLATDELRSVAGMQSDAVRARYPEAPTQVIHRDEFVLVEGGKATGHDPAEPGTAHGEDGHG
jgi:glutamate 5-kinase